MHTIPVFCGGKIVDLVDDALARQMAHGANVELVRKRKTGEIAQVNVTNHGECFGMESHHGNPRRYSHDHETRDNPPRVWTMRHLGNHDSAIDLFVRQIFRKSVLDNLKRAA